MRLITKRLPRRAAARREFRPEPDALEGRLVLSAATAHAAVRELAIAATSVRPVLGSLQGRVINEATGRGIANVRVELINSQGRVQQVAISRAGGVYRFPLRAEGAYVVHALVPRRFTQVTPTFPNQVPTGSYAVGYGNSSWTYAGQNSDPTTGPVNPYAWDTVAPAGKLPFQSPINTRTAPTDLSHVLTVDYNPAVPKQLINNGHQLQVQFAAGSTADTISVGGVTSSLAQFHVHTPSETKVDGHSTVMEAHFVNLSEAGGETVVAVFLRLGAHNPALEPVLNAAQAHLTTANSTTPGTVPIDFSGLLPQSKLGWYYEGSLTTPPLSQPVNWFVYATPITLDAMQLAQYKQVASTASLDPNARPDQPLDGRRLNEIDYDVNFQGGTVANLNFGIKRRV